jgi:hypothetical protein
MRIIVPIHQQHARQPLPLATKLLLGGIAAFTFGFALRIAFSLCTGFY